MADTTNTIKTALSVCATTSKRVKELPIKNGQLVFIHDTGRIAFDHKDGRKFYNQVTELQTEKERISLTDPLDGFYFVIDTAIFWRYSDEWIQLTTSPEEIFFIGTELPELGQKEKLYVDTSDREISVWDGVQYEVVADYTKEASDTDIKSLFN